MANVEQLKALLKSHAEGDDERFFAVAMQLAAHEAKLGHGIAAEELRDLIDATKRRRGAGQPVPIGRPRGELANLLAVTWPKAHLNDMVLDDDLLSQIQRIIREQRHSPQILEHGLAPRRKILLVGPPGTGKTLTASVLAGELGIPLFAVRLDGLITKFMGETASKLRQIFDATNQTRGVYFFDEFDAIGSHRGAVNDVGEIRRVLNSFLQMIEHDRSHSLIIAATNHGDVLDRALFRRFDDILHYGLPKPAQIALLLNRKLAQLSEKSVSWTRLAAFAKGLSHAEITRATDETMKDALIQGRKRIGETEVRKMLRERLSMSRRVGVHPERT